MNMIRIKAIPHAKRESVEEISSQILRISVREPAENNLANHRILEIVSEFYEIPLNKLRMISGHHSPTKKIEILHYSN